MLESNLTIEEMTLYSWQKTDSFIYVNMVDDVCLMMGRKVSL